jgi:TetR/AcrR family transcriptional regulator, cholesterol catabolism regulator
MINLSYAALPLRRTRLEMKRTLAQREDRASWSARRKKIAETADPGIEEVRPQRNDNRGYCQKAGVDRATIYYYFADKGAIFRQTITEVLSR